MNTDITELFCFVDDFCKEFEPLWKQRLLEYREIQRNRECKISLSEIMTILIYFQQTPFKCFKHYYLWLREHFHSHFPRMLSYSRFVRIKARAIIPLFALFTRTKGACTGISYIDSTTLKVCHNKRIPRHRVFQNIAQRGKGSMGWFFGFKLHTVINHKGEIVDIQFTSGNVDDRKPVLSFGKKLFGKLFGDRGYISENLATLLKEFDVDFITKIKKNMKKRRTLSSIEKALLQKRSLIETVFGELKMQTNLEHSRHRAPRNFFVNLLSSLVAYNLNPKKPQIGILKLL